MDRQTIFGKLATYYSAIKSLSNESLFTIPSVDRVFPNKSLSQKAYVEVREMKFDGRVTDYMAWISTAFLIDRIRTSVPKGVSVFEWVKLVCDQYDCEDGHVRNFIRLWRFYDRFHVLLRAEIRGESLDKNSEEPFSLSECAEQIKISAFLSAFEFMISKKKADKFFKERLEILFRNLDRLELP